MSWALFLSFTLEHQFYQSSGSTELIGETKRGNLWALGAYQQEREVVLRRISHYGEINLMALWPTFGDSSGLGVSGRGKLQEGPGYSGRELRGAVVSRLGLGWARLLGEAGSSRLASQDTECFNPFLGLNLDAWSSKLTCNYESSPLYTTRSLTLAPSYSSAVAAISLLAEASDRSYATLSGLERSRRAQAKVNLVPRLGPLSFPVWASYGDWRYTLNTTGTSRGGDLGVGVRLRLFGVEVNLNRLLGSTDYLTWQGDETREGATLQLRGTTRWRGMELRYGGVLDKRSYNYPQGRVPDDRDERTQKTFFEVRAPWLGGRALFGLSERRQDMVFVRSQRSGDTKSLVRYGAHAAFAHSGRVSFELRGEISATYTRYRFRPEDNSLVRYLHLRLLVSSGSERLLWGVKLGDQGGFLGGLYSPGTKNKEVWIEPWHRLYRGKASSLWLIAKGYQREDGLTEAGIGMSLTGMVEAKALLVRREGSLLWETSLRYSP